MKVKELIEWLSLQNPEMDVEVGMNQEYQNSLEIDCVQVCRYQGQEYILLGEPAEDWEEHDGQPDEAQEWESFDPDC